MPGEKLLKTLELTWNALVPLQAPMAVMGGLADSVFNHAQSTRDADILVQVEEKDTERVLEVASQAGILPRRFPPMLKLDKQWILFLSYQPPGEFYEIKVDILYADNDYQREALARRVQVEIPGCQTPVSILACEDLIIHKLYAGRIIDLADCAHLMRANAQSLDFTYLKKYLASGSLQTSWKQVWQEALPGTPDPLSPS